jgi:plasmid stabilization system protein ParE
VAVIRLASEMREDLDRILAHLRAHDPEHGPERIGALIDAIEVLARSPLIGRPSGEGRRELVVGRGTRGDVVLYRFDPVGERVFVLGVRAQREAGFQR